MPRYGFHPLAGSGRAAAFRSSFAPRRIPRPPVEVYERPIRTILAQAGTSVVSMAGAATVQLGPSGLGTRWYPTQANVSTTSGAADVSTVALYRGGIAIANLLGGSSYAGGQDTIGLNLEPLDPGDLLIAVWSGGKTGDTATLVIHGEQDALWPR